MGLRRLTLVLSAALAAGYLRTRICSPSQRPRHHSIMAEARQRSRLAVGCDTDEQQATVSWREEDATETVVPSVSLTRSRDGSTGTATFRFEQPSVLSLDDVWDRGLVTGLWLRDSEGVLWSSDLEATFEQGKPTHLTAMLVLKSRDEWERFMRFMDRYAKSNELAFRSAATDPS